MPSAELPPVFILAAGLGTRLGFESAKTLFPVTGRPVLEWILLECRRQGVRRVVVTVLRQHEQALSRFCAHGVPAGIKLSVSVDETPQGTLGTLRIAHERFPSGRLIIWLGDIVGAPPLARLEEMTSGASAVLLAHWRPDYEQSGVLTVAGASRLTGFREKPGRLPVPAARVWAGVATIEASQLAGPAGHDLGRDLWPVLAASGRCRVLDSDPAEPLIAVDRRADAGRLAAALSRAGTR